MPDAAFDDPVRILPGELLGVRAWLRVRRTVGVALKRDGRHGDDRTRRKLLFEIVILGLPLGESEAPAIVMNDDGDVIWIVE